MIWINCVSVDGFVGLQGNRCDTMLKYGQQRISTDIPFSSIIHNSYNNINKRRCGKNIINYSDRSSNPTASQIISKVATGGLGLFMAIVLVFGNELVSFDQSRTPNNAFDVVVSTPNTYQKLSKNEINDKLAQIPIFFVLDAKKADTFYEDSDKKTVNLYMDVEDAKRQQDRLGENYRVGVTTLDEVFYPLITKKVKIASFLSPLVKNSNPDSKYLLIPSKFQYEFAKAIEGEKVDKDTSIDSSKELSVPVFVSDKIAFKDQKGNLQIPLFLQQEDLLDSWNRLRESSSNSLPEEPTLKISTIERIIQSMEDGSSQGKALEFFPSIENLQAAKNALQGEGKPNE